MVTMVSRLIVVDISEYANMESLCCLPETNIMLYFNYNQLKIKFDF